jgi:hypothetical protein
MTEYNVQTLMNKNHNNFINYNYPNSPISYNAQNGNTYSKSNSLYQSPERNNLFQNNIMTKSIKRTHTMVEDTVRSNGKNEKFPNHNLGIIINFYFDNLNRGYGKFPSLNEFTIRLRYSSK